MKRNSLVNRFAQIASLAVLMTCIGSFMPQYAFAQEDEVPLIPGAWESASGTADVSWRQVGVSSLYPMNPEGAFIPCDPDHPADGQILSAFYEYADGSYQLADAAHPLRPGKAYWVKTRPGTFYQVGVPVGGAINVTVHRGWNMLANPFTRELDFDSQISGMPRLLGGPYIYTATYESPEDNVIKQFQGFWVNFDNEGQLTFWPSPLQGQCPEGAIRCAASDEFAIEYCARLPQGVTGWEILDWCPEDGTICVEGVPAGWEDNHFGVYCVPAHCAEPEACGDGADNDCDGIVDDGCDPDGLPDQCSNSAGCYAGQVCIDGLCWSEECDPVEGGPETCGDQIDNDCNGLIDEGCSDPAVECASDEDCDGAFCIGGKCWVQEGCEPDFPNDPAIGEICADGLDNDCDGQVDEGCAAEGACTADADCAEGQYCLFDLGQCWVAECILSGDSFLEICGDNIDNNCNGVIDENCGDLNPGCQSNDDCWLNEACLGEQCWTLQ